MDKKLDGATWKIIIKSFLNCSRSSLSLFRLQDVWQSECVCMCVKERERECMWVSVCRREERERKSESVFKCVCE